MQDRFLFRGKTLGSPNYPSGKFIYGFLYQIGERPYIYTFNSQTYEVQPETVGQCTGLKDKNSKLIYEGDIVKVIEKTLTNTLDQLYPMLFNEKTAKFGFKHPDGHFFYYTNNEDFSYEIIGNIHENPELLGDKTDE